MFSDLKQTLHKIYSNPEIRQKLYFSLLILVFFRALAAIPVVGIPSEALQNIFGNTGFGDLVSTVSGSVLQTASIVAIGLSPYINASIIFQLLSSVIPKLEEIRKEGTQGQRKIGMWTRILTVPLATMQAFVIYQILLSQGMISRLGTLDFVTMAATLTAGGIVMMWFSELISESGYGRGSGYIISLGILSTLPGSFMRNLRTRDWFEVVVLLGIYLLLVVVTVVIVEAERRVKIVYSRRVRGSVLPDSFLPLKIAQFGVMPVIFAISLISFPQMMAQFIVSKNIMGSHVVNFASKTIEFLSDPVKSNIFTVVAIIAFSFFYVTIVFNPKDVAENLQKQGGFIPGIRPGKQTEKYLRGISTRLTTVGALYLAVLAITPNILQQVGILSFTFISGTGLLILVGVLLDVRRQILSEVVTKSYDYYL